MLIDAIDQWTEHTNRNPKVVVGNAEADENIHKAGAGAPSSSKPNRQRRMTTLRGDICYVIHLWQGEEYVSTGHAKGKKLMILTH